MIEKLNAMHDDFVSQKNDEKYRWIARFRKYLSKNEELRSEYHHPLFVVMIEHHIEQLQKERDFLQKIITQYEDRMLQGFDHQPERYFKNSRDVSEVIANRIVELDKYIEEYTEDLKKRRKNHKRIF